MKVNFRTQMRKHKLKNLSDLSYESKIPVRQLEELFNGDLTKKDLDTIERLKDFFQCRLESLLDAQETMWGFNGCSYDGAIGLVYFIKNENTGFVKIGFSYDLLTRLQTLATQQKSKMELVHYVSGYDVGTLESIFHTMFSDKRINGEWFDLSESEVEKIKQF